MQGRDTEAIEAFNYIARINRSHNRIDPETRFVEAVTTCKTNGNETTERSNDDAFN